MAKNDLAMGGGGTYETPYTTKNNQNITSSLIRIICLRTNPDPGLVVRTFAPHQRWYGFDPPDNTFGKRLVVGACFEDL